jgi:hypothetical protein
MIMHPDGGGPPVVRPVIGIIEGPEAAFDLDALIAKITPPMTKRQMPRSLTDGHSRGRTAPIPILPSVRRA